MRTRLNLSQRLHVAPIVAALLLAAPFSGCRPSSEDHYQKALELEQHLLTKGSEITYADTGYLAVAKELEQVRPWSDHYDDARGLLKKIKEARRLHLNETRYLSYLPKDLEGVSLASFIPPRIAPSSGPSAPPVPRAAATNPEAETIGASAPRPVRHSRPSAARTRAPSDHEVEAPVVPGAAAPPNPTKAATAPTPPVILYMTSWCPYCRKTAAYLKRRGVDFIEKDIEKDPRAAEELIKKVRGYGGVPVVDIGGTIIRGYSPQQMDAALARRGH